MLEDTNSLDGAHLIFKTHRKFPLIHFIVTVRVQTLLVVFTNGQGQAVLNVNMKTILIKYHKSNH